MSTKIWETNERNASSAFVTSHLTSSAAHVLATGGRKGPGRLEDRAGSMEK